MVTHFVLTLNGSAQVLSTVTSVKTGLLKQLILHTDAGNTHVIYVGGTGLSAAQAAVSSTDYGFRIEIPVSTVPPAPTILEAINTSLADWQVIGTNGEKLHITCISA
jgi:hypothetical protein